MHLYRPWWTGTYRVCVDVAGVSLVLNYITVPLLSMAGVGVAFSLLLFFSSSSFPMLDQVVCTLYLHYILYSQSRYYIYECVIQYEPLTRWSILRLIKRSQQSNRRIMFPRARYSKRRRSENTSHRTFQRRGGKVHQVHETQKENGPSVGYVIPFLFGQVLWTWANFYHRADDRRCVCVDVQWSVFFSSNPCILIV